MAFGSDQQEETQANEAIRNQQAQAAREAAAAAAAEAERQRKIAEQNATYGTGRSLGQVQDLFLNRKQAGVEFQKSASDIARDIISGVKPSVATIQSRQNIDQGIAAFSGASNAQPTVDAALVNRNASGAVQQQQRQAMLNAAMLRAQEVAQARDVITKAGGNIQGMGLTDYGNILKVRQGLQQQANNEATQADMINKQKQAQESAAGLAALAAGAGLMFSDRRAKKNIKFLYRDVNDLNVYSYEYLDKLKNHPLAIKGECLGYMAQEVEHKYPQAVFQVGEYKAVDYTKIPRGN